MKQIVRWTLALGLLVATGQISSFLDLTAPAEAQALCNIHLPNSLNCIQKKPSHNPPQPTPPPPKIVCVNNDRAQKDRCEKTIAAGIRKVQDGGTVIVEQGQEFSDNLVITKPLVLCAGNTMRKKRVRGDWLAKPVAVKHLECAKPRVMCDSLVPKSERHIVCMKDQKDSIFGKGRFPSNVFILKARDSAKPCIDINPKDASAEVVISGIHVTASRDYRAGECVWQKRGSLKIVWSDLFGDNTAVGMLALTGKSAHVEGNFIEGGQNGIKVFPPDPGTFVLLENDISHATTGLRVQGGSNVFGIGNKIHENSGDGIVGLEGDAFYARNEVVHNQGSGIRLARDRITHALPRTQADVLGNTLDWNEEGEVRAEGRSVVTSAANCVVVKNKVDYWKHMRKYRKQKNLREYADNTGKPGKNAKNKPWPRDESGKSGMLTTPVHNTYWLETWGLFPNADSCDAVKGKKWRRRCFRYLQMCQPK